MSRNLGVKEKYVMTLGNAVATKIREQMHAVAQEMHAVASMGGAESTMVERLTQHIISNSQKLQKQFNSI